MVANRDAGRQFTLRAREKGSDFSQLRSDFRRGVYLFYTIIIVGCASSPRSEPGVKSPVSPVCQEIRSFLHGTMARSTDVITLQKQLSELVRKSTALSGRECPERERLVAAEKILALRYPTDAASLEARAASEKWQDQVATKTESFQWRLPGEKSSSSRGTYRKRLASMPERHRRESFFKLFSPSRARKWGAWGMKDLIRARNKEAAAAGESHYLQLALKRQGQSPDTVRSTVKSIRNSLRPGILKWLKRTADGSGISSLEPWDLAWLCERAWGTPVLVPPKNFSAPVVIEQVKGLLQNVGIDFASVVGTSDLAELSVRLDPPFLRSDFGHFTSGIVVESYFNDVKQVVPLFQRPSESSREAIYQLFFVIAMDSTALSTALQKMGVADLGKTKGSALQGLALTAYQNAFLFDVEWELYARPDADPAEIWATLYGEYWGIEISPFYAAWDEDLYIRQPGGTGERALGALVAAGLWEDARRLGPNFSAALGRKLRTDFFPYGSEMGTLELLAQTTGRGWSVDDLVGILKP